MGVLGLEETHLQALFPGNTPCSHGEDLRMMPFWPWEGKAIIVKYSSLLHNTGQISRRKEFVRILAELGEGPSSLPGPTASLPVGPHSLPPYPAPRSLPPCRAPCSLPPCRAPRSLPVPAEQRNTVIKGQGCKEADWECCSQGTELEARAEGKSEASAKTPVEVRAPRHSPTKQ